MNELHSASLVSHSPEADDLSISESSARLIANVRNVLNALAQLRDRYQREVERRCQVEKQLLEVRVALDKLGRPPPRGEAPDIEH